MLKIYVTVNELLRVLTENILQKTTLYSWA